MYIEKSNISLLQIVITEENAVSVGERLKNLTSNPTVLNKNDITLTADILEKIVQSENKSKEVQK